MMNNSHLPAGRAAQGGPVGGAVNMDVGSMGLDDQSGPGGPGGGVSPNAAVLVGGGPGGPGGGPGGGRNGGGRRGRPYGSHYHPNGRHNQNNYHPQSGYAGQFGHHNNGHQMAQQIYPPPYGTPGPFVPNSYGYQMHPPYAPNNAMQASFIYQYGRPMPGIGPFPIMSPSGMPPPPPPIAQTSPGHPQHPPPPQHHMPPPPHMSPYSRSDPTVVSSSMPPQALPPSLPPLLPPNAHSPLPQFPGMPMAMAMPSRPDILQAPPPHMPQLPIHSPPVLPLTPSPTLSSHAAPESMSPVASQQQLQLQQQQPLHQYPHPQETAPCATAPLEAAAGKVAVMNKEVAAHAAATAPSAPGVAAMALSSAFRPPVSRFARMREMTQFGDMAENVSTDQSHEIRLPWLSRPDVPFPAKSSRLRRRRKTMGDNLELPQNSMDSSATTGYVSSLETSASTEPITRTETPSTQDLPSENAPSTSPTTPSSVQQTEQAGSAATPTPAKASVVSPISRTAVPIVPIVPIRSAAEKHAAAAAATTPVATAATSVATSPTAAASAVLASTAPAETNGATELPDSAAKSAETPPPAAPAGSKLWSGLFNRSLAGAGGVSAELNGSATAGQAANGANGMGAFSKAHACSLAEALLAYRVETNNRVAFIEPRGLINTGNMCYMNSVLQVLVFCTPFYDFLDQVSRKAAHRFKSDTPLLDAMIMFIREFKVIDCAEPVDLRRRLKSEELEKYGEAFTPEFVYEAIKQLSRFESMRRGHQQDAEEFLGFLLECLNEECTKAVQDSVSATHTSTRATTPAASVTSEVPDASGGDGWLEVGPRQRAAVTRSSGHISTSPVNSIFGGKLRSELRVPGLKDSVTLEPYQSLQLDIDSPQVRNILDALRGLTKPEVLHGDFGSPHGKDVPATKQVFLETLPPVLILHLKRFQFDWQGNGTVKIWKKIGYPLELEIPRELFGRHRRNMLLSEPLLKYRLNAVVYHHGKQASGGHYTVDLLREDGREWIRLDDTVIRRIRSEDVAEAGAEEAPAGRADAPAAYGNGNSRGDGPASGANGTAGTANRFAGMGDDDAGENENGWRQVTSPVNGAGKKWSSVANGATTGSPGKTKQHKENIRDNRVAYLLFYQRVN